MAKKLIATGYRIDRNSNTIYLDGNILHQRLLLITDVTVNRIIYNFADEGSGLVSISYNNTTDETALVCRQSFSVLGISNTDTLQVLIEEESSSFKPDDTFVDPVSKFRVSQPENLIDTDFEYGLQTTKWETLKLVNNIPSFYSKGGAVPITVTSVQTSTGSASVIVTAPSHGLAAGSPFELTGLTSSSYEGGFIVTSVINSNQFTYLLSFNSTITQELSTVYTACLPGAFYFGSQISVVDIETNGTNPSHLTVTTRYPHGFSINTPFYFLNTVAVYRQDIVSTSFVLDDTVTSVKTTTSTSIGESVQDYRVTSVTPYKWIGKSTVYFDSSNIVTKTTAPITSARKITNGAGYQSTPIAVPVFTTGNNSNFNAFNATATGVTIGTGVITLAAATTMQTGDRVEYHAYGLPLKSTTVSATAKDPLQYLANARFLGSQEITANGSGTTGYSPGAMSSQQGIMQGQSGETGTVGQPGYYAGALSTTVTIGNALYYGTLEIGQSIQVFNGATAVVPVGSTIANFTVDVLTSTTTITIAFPYPLKTGLSTINGCSFYANWIDPIQNTIRTDLHGFETGDRIIYRVLGATKGTYTPVAPDAAGPAGLTTDTGYYVIKVTNNLFKLAATYQDALRGIQIDLTNIGVGTYSGTVGSQSRFLPGIVFTSSSSSIYLRVITSTSVTLHPTANDAVAGTNTITFSAVGVGTTHQLVAARAKFNTTVSGGQLSTITVADSGFAYDKSSSISITAFQTQRSLILPTLSGGSILTGGTNTVYFRSQTGDAVIYPNMLMNGTGFTNATVVTVSSPDVNGLVTVVLNSSNSAAISAGAVYTFSDNSGTAASAVPDVRTSCFNINNHGYSIGDPIFLYSPPGNTFPTGITASRGYFVYPIDDNYFTLVSAYPGTGSSPVFSAVNSATRVSITTTGTVVSNRKFALTRSFRVTAGGTNSILPVEGLLTQIYGLTVNDPFIVSTTDASTATLANVTFSTDVAAPINNTVHTIYYTRSTAVAGNTTNLTFATTTTGGGAVTAVGAKGGAGEIFITPVLLIADSDSLYIPNHGFSEDDYVLYTTTLTAIGGLNASAGSNGYLISKLSSDRVKLKNRSTGTLIDLTSFGTGSHSITNIKYNPIANTINKTAHGFQPGQQVSYDSAGNPVIDGLNTSTPYFIKQLNNDSFRVSDTSLELIISSIVKPGFGATPTAAEITASKTMTVTFTLNHGLSVGQKIIIANNQLSSFVNGPWTVASIPASPTVNGQPSSITITIPEFINSAVAISQSTGAMGIGYRFIDINQVTGNDSIITPVATGSTFTTVKSMVNSTVTGGNGIVTNHLIESSPSIPVDSKVTAISGSNIKTQIITFKQASIATVTRSSNVTTVVTTAAHGYTDQQTVTITGVTDGTFNTAFTPVIATVVSPTSFTYPNTGTDGSSTGGTVTLALTSSQATTLAANGINSNTGANNVTVAAQSVGATFTTGTIATATQITNVSKTLVVNAGLIGQTTLIVPDVTGLAVGMPVAGSGIATTAKIMTIIDSTLIELTAPHTANTTASAYVFFQIQAGQDVSQSSTTASTIASATASASSTFNVSSPTNIAAGLYVSGNRSTTTFTANANAGTSTFDIASTSNTYTTNRVETTRFQLDSTYASTAVFTSGANKFSNFRVFKADVGGDVNITNDTITLLSHPYLTGDQVKYVSGGTEPGGLTNGLTYYVIRVDANTIKLASTLSNASAGTAVDINGLGAGSGHVLESAVVWGDAVTGLVTGMHINVTAGTGTVPQGTVITGAIRTVTGGTTPANRGFAFVLSTGIPAARLGTYVTGAGEATITGVTIKGGVGSSGTTIYTDSTTNLAVGMVPTILAGATSGAFAVNTYITSIVNSTSFTVNNAPTTAIAGAAIIAGAGSYASGTPTKIFCSTTSGLEVGAVINVGASQQANSTGAFAANTRVASIIDAYSFTVTDAPTTALAGSKLRAGVDNSTTTLYVPNVTGYQVGQFLAIGTASQGTGTGVFAASTKITAITAGAKPSLTVNTAPTTALLSATIQAGSQSTTTSVTVPTTVGLNTGMTVTLTGGTGVLVGGTTITAIDPAALTITLSAAPTTALVGASFSATIANAVATGVYVYSSQPNFPENAYVTNVSGTTITINTTHGGVTSGNSVTFSPFQVGTYVTGIATNTVTLNQGHAGILGGTALDFSALPPRTVLGAIPAYVATSWPLRFEFPNALTTALGAYATKPMTFTGVGKNLGATTRYKTTGTHVFTRSSDSDGVYSIESVSKTNPSVNGYDKFTVRTGSNIPFNTKSFTNSELDLANNYIKITNHKFRDGTSLIYRAGSATPLGTASYVDSSGNAQTALIDGVTYYAVVVDPNYIRIATSFDNATSSTPITLDLTSGTNGTQSFDTYSIVGLTRGIGNIIATEDSDIILGNNTKFLTNFKGGDTLRFFTSANPGSIQNYTVASVKSDTSIKLRTTVPSVNGVTINQITSLTATGALVAAGSQNGVTTQEITLSSLTTGVSTTASGTTAVTNLVTVGTTVGMTVNQPIVIYGTFGGIISGTTYYIKTIPSGTTLTLSTVSGGSELVLTTTTGQSAQTLSGSVIAPGYLISGSGIPLNTKIGAITNIANKTVTLLSTTTNTPSYITVALSTTAIVVQPTFEYFINTNVYVKSSATTQHRPFDGGVGMTTGLTPDSSIIRQTRKYFRYQSGKGIQVSMAINFNPPTDMEELTSSLNVATVRTDLPHGFKPGTVNTIRVTDAQVPTGNNGYNGSFIVSSVPTDYTFTYVYEDTALIGKATNGSNIISNVVSFAGIEAGKTLLTGTFGATSIAANNIITAIDSTARTVTLTTAASGSSTTASVSSITRASNLVTLVTSTEHGVTTGDYISVSGVTASSSLNVGYVQVTVVDSTTLQYTQESSDSTGSDGTMTLLQRFTTYRSNGSNVAYGFPKFNLTSWNDASIRNGLYDNQNGMFLEYDGRDLYCVRRSSVQQISGKINATYRSSLITGTDSKFSTQLSVGEYVVIRGMSYKVIGIDSDTRMYVQPEYRGSTLSNIIGTKTIDTKTPQSQWSVDKCDGMGRSGYILDLNRIQMAYIDYSWYGAGKVRFGFKDQNGHVIYVHEYIHNNKFVEAYMRSGNIPARYEVITQGEPTFSPQLFHWGTSVIMDGRFDDDKAYLFTADSNTITLTNGGSIIAVSRVAGTGATAYGPIKAGSNSFQILSSDSSKFSAGSTIQVQNDPNNFYLPANTTVKSVNIIPTSGATSYSTVTLSAKFRFDVNVGATGAAFTVGGGTSAASISSLSPVPLVSIRLAPSVDNGLTGGLGFRDVINRMQLSLKSCGVLVTHESEVKLWLNSDLSDSNFLNNTSPSLSQLYKHTPGETIKSGIQLFSFRASGGSIINTTTGQRSLTQTGQDLTDIATLGNSILGGDEVFPNGPDILTITVTPIDSSTVNGSAPFQASARITWSESQA